MGTTSKQQHHSVTVRFVMRRLDYDDVPAIRGTCSCGAYFFAYPGQPDRIIAIEWVDACVGTELACRCLMVARVA